MTEIETKIKKAFEISDLLYSRERDKILSDLEKDLPRISRESQLSGGFNTSIHVNKIFERRIEAIKQLVNFRIKSDTREINGVIDLITVEVCEKIYGRAKHLIEAQIENLKFEMEKFCRRFPGPNNYLEMIDGHIKEEKNKLISYTKREVEIFQRQYGSNMQRDEKKEKKFIVSEIIEKVDSINSLMEQNYKIKLFEIQEQKIWNSLFEPCKDRKDFVLHITTLSSLVDWINIKGLKDSLKIESKNGSINYLERFLQEKYSNYDLNIIKKLRRIFTIRKMFVHKVTQESIKAIKELGEDYPNTNHKRLWDKLLLDFYASLRQLEEILIS
jgi:hypothetical protein